MYKELKEISKNNLNLEKIDLVTKMNWSGFDYISNISRILLEINFKLKNLFNKDKVYVLTADDIEDYEKSFLYNLDSDKILKKNSEIKIFDEYNKEFANNYYKYTSETILLNDDVNEYSLLSDIYYFFTGNRNKISNLKSVIFFLFSFCLKKLLVESNNKEYEIQKEDLEKLFSTDPNISNIEKKVKFFQLNSLLKYNEYFNYDIIKIINEKYLRFDSKLSSDEKMNLLLLELKFNIEFIIDLLKKYINSDYSKEDKEIFDNYSIYYLTYINLIISSQNNILCNKLLHSVSKIMHKYIIIEGSDKLGKTTTYDSILTSIKNDKKLFYGDNISYHLPSSDIYEITSNLTNKIISKDTRQILFSIDCINKFKETIRNLLDNSLTVVMDRLFLSNIIYTSLLFDSNQWKEFKQILNHTYNQLIDLDFVNLLHNFIEIKQIVIVNKESESFDPVFDEEDQFEKDFDKDLWSKINNLYLNFINKDNNDIFDNIDLLKELFKKDTLISIYYNNIKEIDVYEKIEERLDILLNEYRILN